MNGMKILTDANLDYFKNKIQTWTHNEFKFNFPLHLTVSIKNNSTNATTSAVWTYSRIDFPGGHIFWISGANIPGYACTITYNLPVPVIDYFLSNSMNWTGSNDRVVQSYYSRPAVTLHAYALNDTSKNSSHNFIIGGPITQS